MFELEDIVKSANVYLIAKDKNFRFLYCSENFAAGLGLDSPYSIVGKTDYDLFVEDVADIYRAGDIHTLNLGSFVNVREFQPHVHRIIQILVNKNKLFNQAGELAGVAVSFVDISEVGNQKFKSTFNYQADTCHYEFSIGGTTEYFTSREYDTFQEILLGKTAKQIAAKFNLSPRTIECYINNIKLKLQCHSKYHIIEAALRYGLISNNNF